MKDGILYAVFLNSGGYDLERQIASESLKTMEYYEVQSIEIGSSSSKVTLKDHGSFNTVMFDFFYNGKEYNIYKNKEKLKQIKRTFRFAKYI